MACNPKIPSSETRCKKKSVKTGAAHRTPVQGAHRCTLTHLCSKDKRIHRKIFLFSMHPVYIRSHASFLNTVLVKTYLTQRCRHDRLLGSVLLSVLHLSHQAAPPSQHHSPLSPSPAGDCQLSPLISIMGRKGLVIGRFRSAGMPGTSW